jgi:site-specific DNA recombinase
MLTDIRHIYDKATTIQKREFVNMVFDNNLHYQEGIYRIPTTLDLLSHNASTMEEKGYLIYNKKRDNLSTIPQSGK